MTVAQELLAAAAAAQRSAQKIFSQDEDEDEMGELVESDEEDEQHDPHAANLKRLQERDDSRYDGPFGFLGARTACGTFSAKSYWGPKSMHEAAVEYVQNFPGGDIAEHDDVPCMLCGSETPFMIVCEICSMPVCTIDCLEPATRSMRRIRKAGPFKCHCCIAVIEGEVIRTESEPIKVNKTDALLEAKPVVDTGSDLTSFVVKTFEGMRSNIEHLAESVGAFISQGEVTRAADVRRIENLETAVTSVADAIKIMNTTKPSIAKIPKPIADQILELPLKAPAISKPGSVQDRVEAIAGSSKRAAPASDTLFARMISAQGPSGSGKPNGHHRQLAQDLLTEGGIKRPELAFYNTPARQVFDEVTGAKMTLKARSEKTALKWTFEDFIKKCMLEQARATESNDHEVATAWLDLMKVVSDFNASCHSWEDGGRIFFLMVFELIADDKLKSDELVKGSPRMLEIQMRVNTELMRRQTEANAKAAAKAPAPPAAPKKPGVVLSDKHMKNFLAWKAEGDHSTKCPKCDAKYQHFECIGHYKHCAQLKELRELHGK